MKKILAFLLTALMVFSVALVSCDNSTPNNDNNPGNENNSGNETPTVKDVAISDIVAAIETAYGDNYFIDESLTGEFFTDRYGVAEDLCKEYYAGIAMISARVDTLVAIRANEGKGDEIETALKAYDEKLKADTFQYPMNLPKIAAAEVYRVDDYIFFLLTGAIYEGEDEAEALKFYQEQIKIAKDTIDGLLK